MINIVSSSRYKISKKKLRPAILKLLLQHGLSDNYTVNLAFVGKNKMKDISNKYKQEDIALPILTFLYDDKESEGRLLGEILICYPQAVLLAAERGKRVDDVILNLVDHGIKNLTQKL